MFKFRYHTALVVEFIQPCLVRFIYLSPANRVHSLYLSECADSLIYSTGSGDFRTKSRPSPSCVPLEGKYRSDREKWRGGEQMTEVRGGQYEREREREKERERQKEK